MSNSLTTLGAATLAALALSACDGDRTSPTAPANPPAVRLSISADLSQPRETCKEIRVQAAASRLNRPVRGIVVNFVPLSGSVFAAAVATNKDGAATTYWNLGHGSERSVRLIARAVDEDGNRVLDDTLTVDRWQKPTAFLDIVMYFDQWPSSLDYRLVGLVKLIDGCGDPIDGAMVTATYTGPVAPISPTSDTFATFWLNEPDEFWRGTGAIGFRFSKDAGPTAGHYEIRWSSVDVPDVTLIQYIDNP